MATTTSTSASGSTFNFTGAISGLDTSSLIQAMLAVEKAPLTGITTQRTSLTATKAGYEQVRSLMSTLLTRARAFTSGGAAGARTAASSNETVVKATAAADTVPGSYSVIVDHLATSTRATSTAALGTAITAADLDTPLSSLQLPGSITAGTVGIVVDGKVVTATIGAPGTTTLRQATDAIAAAIGAQIQANEGAGSTATVSASVVGNQLQLSLTGSSATHAISFGVGGDSSNALSMLGLAGLSAAGFSASTAITGKSALGVVRTTTALDAAGLAGIAPASTGTMTVNGAAIAYDTSTDTLTGIIGKINNSSAGVVASLDRGGDRLILTSKTGGAAPISIADTGPLASALRLAPGTTDAQALGTQAQVTIDGRTYLSDTNQVSNAIDGVRLTLFQEGTVTLTVAPDGATTQGAIQGLVDAYNTLADALSSLTANDPKGTKGSLAGTFDVANLALSLRTTILGYSGTSGKLLSFADIGVTSGAVGSAVGTTNHLSLDASKLASALESDPAAVSSLITAVATPLASVADAWTKVGGQIDSAEETITSQLKALDDQEADVNDRIAIRQAALQAKFTAMEKLLAQMQTTTNSLTNTIAQQNRNTG